MSLISFCENIAERKKSKKNETFQQHSFTTNSKF